ncbi:MAG: hypothetical protein KDD56_03820, partial [Bdellovibrionales bacterium]|nr:hypothetical protein [Bdellovibrionales bacterium]
MKDKLGIAKTIGIDTNAFIEVFERPIVNAKGSLSGLSFAVKDNIAIKDKKLSFGTSPSNSKKMPVSASIIEKLLALGAECIGRTNLDEYALNFTGSNPYFGTIGNPKYPNFTVLGS